MPEDRESSTPERAQRGLAFFAPARRGRSDLTYWTLSTRPLHILIYLLPLLILYETGAATYVTRIAADTLLSQFFGIFGVATLFIPGIALVTVLLVWHIFAGDRWALDARTLPAMLVESVAWTLPLIVFGAALGRLSTEHPGMVAAAQTVGGGVADSLRDRPWQERLTVALGAGLYEEMMFRMIGIALLHLVFKDILGAGQARASILAVTGAAIAFALYHPLGLSGGGGWETINWKLGIFALVGGIYFGTVYVMRGFGIVVGAHALYDIAALFL